MLPSLNPNRPYGRSALATHLRPVPGWHRTHGSSRAAATASPAMPSGCALHLQTCTGDTELQIEFACQSAGPRCCIIQFTGQYKTLNPNTAIAIGQLKDASLRCEQDTYSGVGSAGPTCCQCGRQYASTACRTACGRRPAQDPPAGRCHRRFGQILRRCTLKHLECELAIGAPGDVTGKGGGCHDRADATLSHTGTESKRTSAVQSLGLRGTKRFSHLRAHCASCAQWRGQQPRRSFLTHI